MWKGKQCHLKAPAVVSQSRTHSRDSDASHAPAEDGLLGYTTAQPQKGRNKETPPCSSTTAKHRQRTDNKLKREQACRTLGLKEERYVTRVPGASFATSIPGQQLEEPAIGMSTGAGKTGRGREKSYRLLAKRLRTGNQKSKITTQRQLKTTMRKSICQESPTSQLHQT